MVEYEDVSMSTAASTFASAMDASTLKLSDPNAIKDELAHLKEFFSKLKFQYLEQETRDKFLRLLLIDNDATVDQDDVDELVVSNAESKKKLKSLKDQMLALIRESEDIAEEVILVNRTFEARRKDVDDTLGDILALQSELDGLLKAPENENYRTLFNLKKLIDSGDIGLNEAIGIADNALKQEELTLSQLLLDVEKADAEIKTKDRLIATLHEKLRDLQHQLEQAGAKSLNEEPEQVFAQWLRELNAILVNFVPAEVDFHSSGGIHTLTLGGQNISFDDKLHVSSAPFTAREVADINCARGDQKFWKLLRVLGKLILQGT